MVTIHSHKARILVTAPQGEFPKLFENGALRLLCKRETDVLQNAKRLVPIIGSAPMLDMDSFASIKAVL